jgi:hypothetical protein
MNFDWKFRFSLFAALNGFRRAFWFYGCIYLGIGLICASVFMFFVRPGFWLVWLLGIRFGWLVTKEYDNWWWERWTGPYPSQGLSFLIPPYLQDNIAALQEGTYHAAWDRPFELDYDLAPYQPRHSRDTGDWPQLP